MMDGAPFEIYGTREREAEAHLLVAGNLSASLIDGNLRTIRFQGHEVLRGAAFLVRDRDWGTCAPILSDLKMDQSPDRFLVRYTAEFHAPDHAVLTARAEIVGNSDGSLFFEARFSADRPFETARAGFTILHPLTGLVGQPVRVLHGDGSVEQAHWPDLIEPWQPFLNIRAITHGVAPGINAETRLEGDTFEMEDQRNWTDGSYKTYVRPLALPWPYAVQPGAEILQAVRLQIRETGKTPTAPDAAKAETRLNLVPTAIPLPAIGIGLRADCLDADIEAAGRLAEVGAQHLVAHFDPLAGDGSAVLAGYAAIAGKTRLPVTLELALPCKRGVVEELNGIAEQCAAVGFTPETLFVSPAVDRQSTPPGSRWPDCPPLDEVYAAARAAFPAQRLCGGMMSYFTELNRKRVSAGSLDSISHCTNPIVHAADDLSVMQSFEALADVVRSVRAIYPDKPYRIGPSTIAMRQNPYGSAPKDNPALARIPMANRDPRHNGRFGAAFALAYAATVAPAGLELLTLSTLSGPFGLIAGEDEPESKGALRPIAYILKALAGLSHMPLTKVVSSHPDRILGLACAETLLLVNITPEPQAVHLPQKVKAIRDLISGETLAAGADRITVPAYGTVIAIG